MTLNRAVIGFINWKYGAMGHSKSIHKEPITLKGFFKELILSTPQFKCGIFAKLFWGWPRYQLKCKRNNNF